MTSEPHTPEWPPARYRIHSTAHMEALGVCSAIYNNAEYTFFLLIFTYSSQEYEICRFLFEGMSNRHRSDFLTRLAEQRNFTPMHDHVLNFIKCFNIATENKNFLMHSKIMTADHPPDRMSFYKASKANPAINNGLTLDVETVRNVARDLQAVDIYGSQIFLYANVRAPWSRHYTKQEASGLPPIDSAYLKKLPLPKKLLIPDPLVPKKTETPARIAPSGTEIPRWRYRLFKALKRGIVAPACPGLSTGWVAFVKVIIA
ncbi:MAG TPA: hypothetical protein VMB83_08830 [Roseiarcus sp.]|nr:hypothetical protein [Roseiarcus sp.]